MESRSHLVPQLGSVNELYSRIQADPDFLENVDVLPFIHTPLHEASAAGKINMAMELMILKPSLAKKLNAYGFSPLHLAVENNHVELAHRLVNCDPSLIRFPGREGMTPLHLLARKGGLDLLAKFILACPDSIRDVNVNGETALHIMVINDGYEELKVLIGWMQKLRSSDALNTEIHVLNSCDHQGNTALHLAAAKENNHKVVKQLLKCMSLNRNIVNKHGKTPLDVLRDNGAHMNKYTEKLIQKSGGKTKNSIQRKVKPLSDVLRAPVNFWVYCSTRMARHRSRMPENTRNALLVITALIITSTYQTAIQEDKLEDQTIIEMLNEVTVGNRTIWLRDFVLTEDNKNAIAKTAEFDKKKKEIVTGMVVLWGFNTTAYLLSVAWTFILLPAGREYTIWYAAIISALTTSFGLSTYRKYNIYGFNIKDTRKNLLINIYLIVVVAFPVFLFVVYVRWKRSRPKKVSEPKTEHISQGCKSWCSSLCC